MNLRVSTAERGDQEAFVDASTAAGWLAAPMPPDCGGSSLGQAEASVTMEAINRRGGHAGGELRLQGMGVTGTRLSRAAPISTISILSHVAAHPLALPPRF